MLFALAAASLSAAMVPDELLSPQGFLIGAIVLIVILGRLHLQQDARDRAESREWRRLYLDTRRELQGQLRDDERELGIERP